MSDEQGYNGWKNYPTWCVALWVDNDEGTHERRNEIVAEWVEESYQGGTTSELADELREWLRDGVEETFDSATLAGDLLGYALDSVDWHEIAETWAVDALNEAGYDAEPDGARHESERRRMEYVRSL